MNNIIVVIVAFNFFFIFVLAYLSVDSQSSLYKPFLVGFFLDYRLLVFFHFWKTLFI